MINYLECISKYFPNVFVFCYGDGTIYEDLIWDTGDPIPTKTELDAAIFKELQLDKIIELSASCQVDITSGFTSSALGSVNMYDSKEVDQLNLIGAVSAISPSPAEPTGYSMYYASRPVIDGVTQAKTYSMHTYSQLRQVMTDGANYKLSKLMYFNSKRDYINSLTLPEEVNSVTWTSTP